MTYEECAAAGMSVAETARATGKPRSTISAYAKRNGLIFAKGRVSFEISSARMTALNADPEFAERRNNRMKALHADPEFAERRNNRLKALHADPARNPLVLLTPQERTDYNTLKKAGHPRADALRAIGRADLVAK